ncbi:FmdB family zinc ribbon protein [Mucisphaera calidilacus]|uniref:Zinc ribbon domain protein n=1 Tax=Mucisphaera calidilacus TaxID=2527982 RepID=A0A518BW16_9BACT|nr:zinc ribbon domain-containing protein [Mucisphaera calidilacus]QDU71172.1 Zinc ribbon domain protein [Mucisphaera calidilacus]
MPTYDYQCAACGHEFEEFQSITANPLKKCPSCGKLKLQRLIGTGAGVIFKGSGFYETDYRSEGYKKDAKAADEAGKAKTETKSESKSDSKSESKKTDSTAKTEKKPTKEKSTKS